jgi:nucleoid DNA-binding protein
VNKNQLAIAIADRVNSGASGATKVSQAQAKAFLDAFTGIVQDSVAAGEKVVIPGFGTWERKFSAARTATNPANGEKIDVPGRYRAAFKVGSIFKDTVSPAGAA